MSKRTIEVHVLHLSREKLAAAPEGERSLFFLLGHVQNDIMLLNRLFYATAHTDHPSNDKLSRRFGTAQALLLGKLITSKLHGGWEVLQKLYFKNSTSKEYEDILPSEGKEALSFLKKYFGKQNIISNVRNDFGFHYPVNKISAALTELSESEELVLYLAKNGPNSLYYACDLIPNHEMVRSIGGHDLQKSYDRLISETAECAAHFNVFVQNYMIAFIEKNDILAKQPDGNDAIIYENPTRLKSFKMPAIFDARGM